MFVYLLLPTISYGVMPRVNVVRCRINGEVIKRVESSKQAVVVYFKPLHVSQYWPGRISINLSQGNLSHDVISKR